VLVNGGGGFNHLAMIIQVVGFLRGHDTKILMPGTFAGKAPCTSDYTWSWRRQEIQCHRVQCRVEMS